MKQNFRKPFTGQNFLGSKPHWPNIFLDNCVIGQKSLGQLSPWRIVPWTIVATPIKVDKVIDIFSEANLLGMPCFFLYGIPNMSIDGWLVLSCAIILDNCRDDNCCNNC